MAATGSPPRRVTRDHLVAFGAAFVAAALLSPILFAFELILGAVGLIASLIWVRVQDSDAARMAAAVFAGIAAGGLAYLLLGLVTSQFGDAGTGSGSSP